MKRAMFVFGTMAAMAGGALAGPFNANQVGANAKWMMHLDVDGLRSTQVGKLIMQRLTTGADNNKLNALAAFLGSDLRKDLADVTIFGPPDATDEAVVILAGKFNAQQLEAFVKADEAYKNENYKGTPIHSWIDKKKSKRMYGAILNGGAQIVISGDSAAVKAALDTLGGVGGSLATQNGSSLPVAAPNNPVLIAAADMTKIKNSKPNAQTLKAAKAASLSISEQGADVVGAISLEADSAENAQHLNDAARGILAMMQLDDKTDPKTKDALRATTVDLQGSMLKVNIHLPAQTMADALQKKWQEEDANKAAQKTENK